MKFEIPEDLLNDLAGVRLAAFDFDGVFTDNAVYVAQDGSESVRCWRGDGIGLSRLRELGVEVMVISTEVNPIVGRRCEKLGIPCRQACTDKLEELRDLWGRGTPSAEQTLFVGNDLNDAEALQAVGVPVVVADAHPAVSQFARYRTSTRGGYGAVREVCDLVAHAHHRSGS